MKRRLLAWTIVAIGVAAGAVREFAFLNLNYQLDHVRRATPVSYAHSMFQGWVQNWDLGALTKLKWGLALAFSLVMLVLSAWLARVLTGGHRYRAPLAAGFLAVGLVAAALHLLAAWHTPLERVSVQISHIIQYPVPLVFLMAAALLAGGRGREART